MPSRMQMIVLAVVAAFAFGAGYKLRSYQAQADALAEAQTALQEFQDGLIQMGLLTVAEAELARTLEQTLAAIRAGKAETDKEREKEYAKNAVYSECKLPDDGVRLINRRIQARGGANGGAGEHESHVP